MGTANLAYSAHMYPPLPLMDMGAGIQTMYGTLTPPVSRVAGYVGSPTSSFWSGAPETLRQMSFPTLAQAVPSIRDGKADTLFVLPGHSESVTDATMLSALVAGTRIIGMGQGANQPVFRWTATGSQWAVAVADVVFANLYLRLEGANGVVKGILVTGADVSFLGCRMQWASGASNKATIALEVGTGADRFRLSGCKVIGTATHNVTDGIKVVAAVDGLEITDSVMMASATAGNGLIHLTAAATNVLARDLVLYNHHTASTATIAVDGVAANGVFSNIHSATVGNGTASAQGIVMQANALIRCVECYSTDEPIKNGILGPAAGT